MARSMFQVYVQGSKEAVDLYQKAFDAKILTEYKNQDGSYMHVELDVFGQIVALAEALPEAGERIAGTTMQLCFDLGKDNEESIIRAYGFLKEDAQISYPLGESLFSPMMFGLIDKYGVNWNLFV